MWLKARNQQASIITIPAKMLGLYTDPKHKFVKKKNCFSTFKFED